MVLNAPCFIKPTSTFVLGFLLAGKLAADTVVFQGLEHTSLGSASLALTPDSGLRVSNLGNSGNDGVAINLVAASRINVGTGGDDGENGGGSGKGKFALAASGTINAAPNQSIGGSTVRLDSGLISIFANYTGVSSTFRQVEVWNNGNLVAGFSDFSGDVTYPGGFFDFPLDTRMSVESSHQIAVSWSEFDGDHLFTVGSHGQFLGDELRFLNTFSESIGSLSEARLTTEDFEFFTLTNVSVPEPCSIWLGAVGLSACTCGLMRSRRNITTSRRTTV